MISGDSREEGDPAQKSMFLTGKLAEFFFQEHEGLAISTQLWTCLQSILAAELPVEWTEAGARAAPSVAPSSPVPRCRSQGCS